MKIFSPTLKGTTTVSGGITNLSGSFIGTFSGSVAGIGGDVSAYSASVTLRTVNLEAASGSFSTRTTTLEAASGSFSTRTTTLEAASASFSTRTTNIERVYATTGSNTFTGAQTVQGTLTAQTLVVQTVTSSVLFTTGSNIIGSSLSNVQQVTGSLYQTGSTAAFIGSVGIGTNSPSTKLHVYEALTNTTAYLTIQNNRTRNAAVYTQTSNGGFYAGTSIGTDTFNYQIYDGVAGVARITVDSPGNIGMGSSNPVATLPTGSSTLINNGWNFSGAIVASRKVLEINSNDNNGGNVGLFLRQANKSVGLDIWADNYYGNSYIDNRFDDASAYISFRLRTANLANIVQPLTIRADGNVGIGNTGNSSRRLEVSQPSGYSAGIRIIADSGGDAKIQFLASGGSSQPDIGPAASAPNDLIFGAGGSERIRITGGGLVGINTSSPSQKLTINQGATGFNQGVPATSGTTQNGILRLQPAVGTYGESLDIGYNVVTSYAWLQSTNAGNLAVNYPLALNPNGGNVLMNMSTVVGTETLNIAGTVGGSANYGIFVSLNSSVLTAYAMRFYNAYTAAVVGSITMAASSTAYNTSSDYRLKEDLQQIDGLSKVMAIKPYNFKWKGEESRMDGVLAHELQEVLPYAVHGEKDGEHMQGVDYSKIVPVLVKAVQELSAKVAALEAR